MPLRFLTTRRILRLSREAAIYLSLFFVACTATRLALADENRPPPEDLAIQLNSFHAHADCVAITPDGKKAVTGSSDGTAIVWDAESGMKLRTFHVGDRAFHSVSISADGTKVLTSTSSRADIWSTNSGKLIARLSETIREIGAAEVTLDGESVALLSPDGIVTYWNATNGSLKWKARIPDTERRREFIIPTTARSSLAISANGSKILAASQGHQSAVLLDASNGKILCKFEGHFITRQSVSISADGGKVLTNMGIPVLWDAVNGEKLQTYPEARGGWFVALSGKGDSVLAGKLQSGVAHLLDAAHGKRLQSCELSDKYEGIKAVAITSDGSKVLLAGIDNPASIWDARTGECLMTLGTRTKAVSLMAMSSQGRAVFASENGTDRKSVV